MGLRLSTYLRHNSAFMLATVQARTDKVNWKQQNLRQSCRYL